VKTVSANKEQLISFKLPLVLLLLCLLIVIPHRASGGPQGKPPIEKEGILGALSHKVLSKKKLLAQITSRGVDFRLTEAELHP
jgi:hypothetical protein